MSKILEPKLPTKHVAIAFCDKVKSVFSIQNQKVKYPKNMDTAKSARSNFQLIFRACLYSSKYFIRHPPLAANIAK